VGEGAVIRRSVLGPNAIVEAGVTVEDSIVRESILFSGAQVSNSRLTDSMIGRNARVEGKALSLNVGDHSSVV
jgi:glucose-1-phosphate thymidylyltransferase